jgi:putative flippase GtrA
MIFKNDKERRRFIRFAIVGTIGAIIDIGFFNLFAHILAVPVLFSQGISFSLAVISNFIWNRYWTYPDSRQKSLSRQLFQFVVVSVAGLIVRTLIFDWLEQSLIWLSAQVFPESIVSPVVAGHNLALGTVIVVILFWNFFINRYWTFNDVK